MNLVLLATAWGPRFGGINAFNKDFAEGLADVMSDHGRVFCACLEPTADEVREADLRRVTLIPVRGNADLGIFSEDWLEDTRGWLTLRGVSVVDCWIGHDVVSGRAARIARQKFGGSLALIHHMSYSDYQGYKGKLGKDVYMLSRLQEEIFEPDDSFIFSVGPFLRQSAKDLTGRVSFELIPGFPLVRRDRPRRSRLDAITFGRMDRASDAIKQGRLAVAAWGLAHKRSKIGGGSEMWSFPLLSVIGIEEQVLREEEEELKRLADFYADREVNVRGLPFDGDRNELFRILSGANVAMMLSLHDGFGLTGWEAIAAEVPLIVGKNTGLYKLVEERLLGNGTGCLHAVDIKGSRAPGGENFKDEDLDEVCNALLQISQRPDAHRQNAASLRTQLIEKLGCTWQHTARQFLKQIGFEISLDEAPRPISVQHEILRSNGRSVGVDESSERFAWTAGKWSGQLIKARSTSTDYDHTQLIQGAGRVRVIMNDGRHFFKRYEKAFMTRMNGTESRANAIETDICVLAPEGPHIDLVARRSGKTSLEQSGDILSSVNLIKDIFRGSERMNLFGMKDFFPYCLFQYDQTLLINLYPAFERVEELPMLLLSPTGDTSDLYYSILENANLLFHRAKIGQTKWFVRL